MARVQDVAAYILQERGPMTAMKLQKLCYYSYGYHLAWEGERLFPESLVIPRCHGLGSGRPRGSAMSAIFRDGSTGSQMASLNLLWLLLSTRTAGCRSPRVRRPFSYLPPS